MMMLPVSIAAGLTAYLQWVDDETRSMTEG